MLGVLTNNVASVCTGLNRAGKRPVSGIISPRTRVPYITDYIILMAFVKKWLFKVISRY